MSEHTLGERTIVAFGDDAVLVQLPALADVVTLSAALRATPAGIVDVVPAAATILVTFDPVVVTAAAVRSWIRHADTSGPVLATSRTADVTIPVHYNGADLPAAALYLGISAEALVDAHVATEWTVAFTGFAPGFGYLMSASWPYRLPRLDAPRTRVPAGSVALADEYCGVYPRETPGGWQLIGTSTLTLFDAGRTPPSLLSPGTSVRFIAEKR